MNAPTHIEDLATRIRPRTASTLLLWGITIFMLVFVAWAALTELDRTVRGQGRVVPSSQLQIVSNLEGGIVQQIGVRAGQIVRAGQALIRLDPTQTGAEFGSGEATLDALSVKIARLEAEVGGRSPIYPATSDPIVADQIRIEQALHASRMADLSSLLGAAQARQSQAERSVAEAEAAYAARITARDSRQSEAAIMRSLVDRGVEPRLTYVQAESAASVAASEAAAASASIARARASVVEARASTIQLRQDWRSTAANELALAQAERSARRRTMPALAQRVDRTIVRAPLAGRINRVLVTTRGGSVSPGQPLVEIVPSEENLLVEARIRPQDIASVRPGQDARVAITAYDRTLYGTLEAQVVSISPDSLTEERTGDVYYMARVRTTEKGLTDPSGREMPVTPGMVAEVDVLGEKRSILNYLLTPITRLGQTAFRE